MTTVPDSRRNGLAMLTRPIAFTHVRYNLRVPAEEDLFGDPAAGPEQRAGKGVAAAAPPHPEDAKRLTRGNVKRYVAQ